MPRLILIPFLTLLFTQTLHARDLVIHVDMHGDDQTMAHSADASPGAFRDELARLNPDLEIVTIDFESPRPDVIPDDTTRAALIRDGLSRRLGEVMATYPGNVRMLVLDTDGMLSYLDDLGSVHDFRPNRAQMYLAQALAPLRGRLTSNASVVLTGNYMINLLDVSRFAESSRYLLERLGAPRGSLFAMSSLFQPIPSWSSSYLFATRVMTAGMVGVIGALSDLSIPISITGMYFSAMGVPLLFLATRPLYVKISDGLLKDHERDWVAALAAGLTVLAAHAHTYADPKLALTGAAYGTAAFFGAAASQFAMISGPMIWRSRKGYLNTGLRLVLDGRGNVRPERLRADRRRDRRRIFTCEADLTDADAGTPHLLGAPGER